MKGYEFLVLVKRYDWHIFIYLCSPNSMKLMSGKVKHRFRTEARLIMKACLLLLAVWNVTSCMLWYFPFKNTLGLSIISLAVSYLFTFCWYISGCDNVIPITQSTGTSTAYTMVHFFPRIFYWMSSRFQAHEVSLDILANIKKRTKVDLSFILNIYSSLTR